MAGAYELRAIFIAPVWVADTFSVHVTASVGYTLKAVYRGRASASHTFGITSSTVAYAVATVGSGPEWITDTVAIGVTGRMGHTGDTVAGVGSSASLTLSIAQSAVFFADGAVFTVPE